MEIEFDPHKSEANARDRDLPFDLAEQFDFETALFKIDDRYDYGETRIRALGRIGDRVHALVFKETENGIRVISLRKANRREVRIYEQETTQR